VALGNTNDAGVILITVVMVKMRVIKPGEVAMAKQRSTALFVAFLVMGASLVAVAPAAAKSVGADEAVVERVAEEHGRKASELLIHMEQGDLPLFLFLVACAVGGFAAGYYWRTLIAEKARRFDGS